MAIIIELFGLPGSGKTFLANRIAIQLSKRKIKAFNRIDAVKICLKRKNHGFLMYLLKKMPYKIWNKVIHKHYCLSELLSFSSKNMDLTCRYYRILCESGASCDDARIVIGAFSSTCIERELIDSHLHDDEVAIVDEGFCHRLFTLYGNLSIKCSPEAVRSYVHLLPSVHESIFVATPAALCVERMAARRRFPVKFHSLRQGEMLGLLHGGSLLFEQLAKEQQSVRHDGQSSDEPVLEHCLSVIRQACC